MATAQPLETPVSAERRSPLTVVFTALGWTVLILFAALEIFPFVFTVANSFKCLPAVQSYPRSLIPTPPFGVECTYQEGERAGASRSASETSGALTFNPTLEGYREIFDENLPRWLVNTAFFAVAVTILRLGFDSLAGYALARLKFPGNRLLFFTILGTMMVPPIVLLIPRFIILKQLSMLNTYQGLIVPLAVDAFGIFLMKQFFESIPGEIEEAALVDGANRFVLFLRVVLPRIHAEEPDARFLIVGQNPHARLGALAGDPAVKLTGRVPDVRPYMAAAAVYVVPMRIGGGTRLKVLEAMAMGKAIVSTSLGCEGYPVRDGVELLIADSPAEFARAVVALLRDPARRLQLGRAAREFALSRYDWRAIVPRLEAAYTMARAEV